MANIHIRDVPPTALDAVRAAAARKRRSVNAELVEALVEYAERQQQAEHLLKRLAEVRLQWREAFPDGYPPGLEPETVIRHYRDDR